MALLLEPVIKAYHYIIFIIFTIICTSTQTGVGVGFSMFNNQLFENSILRTFAHSISETKPVEKKVETIAVSTEATIPSNINVFLFEYNE